MHSRWYHRPLLHSAAHGEKRSTWLELFYDLVFAAAFIQLGNGLAENVTARGALTFVAVFIALWVAWTGLTFFQNRFTVDDFVHRIAVFGQMFAVGGMALAAPGVLDGKLAPFSIAAGLSQAIVALLHLRAHGQIAESRAYTRYWGWVFAASSVAWFAAASVPGGWAGALWVIAIVGVLSAPLSEASRSLAERLPLDFGHLGERYGLLTIIVLGESFVKVLMTLAAEGAGLAIYVEGGVVLLVTCALWWIYFDGVAGSELRKGRGQWIIWLYGHCLLPLAITAVGVALGKAIHFGWHSPAPANYRWLLSGSLALTFFGVAIIDSVSERKQAELSDRARVNARWASGLFLLVLVPGARALSGAAFLGIVMAVVVAQVVFDMAVAPLVESAHEDDGRRSLAEVAKAGPGAATRRRRDVSEAVRKGTPSSLRRDLYFYFMEGSWTRIFAAFAVVFTAGNAFFAALYLLEPGSIANARAGAFSDAFFFSVQTMATIGYGALSPGSDWGNSIVTVEAAVTTICIAIVTGLVFAKASRPKASVLFSEPILVTTLHGSRTLMFRVGNARGNEVVDATMNVSVLIDEVSPEGHHLRRLHDVPLTRSSSPMFVLSWTAMHTIDEKSPIATTDWTRPEAHISSVIATLVGHDGTYGQTIYARKVWYPEDVRVDHHFVDILSELEDGRLMIDFTRFHDTKAVSD